MWRVFLSTALVAFGGEGVVAAAVSSSASTRTVSFAGSSPTGASVVPKDFVGFGFDGEFLDTYNNQFSANLINAVAERMSARPIIRIGGTSS